MKNPLLILLLTFNLSVNANETHLVCDGEMTTTVLGTKDKIAPKTDPITLTFDDKKNSLQSELLFPTCSGNQEQIDTCKCTFGKTNISCKGLSRNKIDPKVIWSFNFNLNRVSGKLRGISQHGDTGDIDKFFINEYYDYICKLSPIKF